MTETCYQAPKISTSSAYSLPITIHRSNGFEVLWTDLVGTTPIGEANTAGTESEKETNVPSKFAIKLQDKIKKMWPSKVQKAKELELVYPDPVYAIVNLLQDLPGDYDTWQEIIDEPYG